MAVLHDQGAYCSFPSCGRQDFLPFTCGGCNQNFCEEHYKKADHACPSLSSTATVGYCKPVAADPAVPRCPVKGCKELLYQHNTFHCQRCSQDVCIKHRFEEDHPCISVEEAVMACFKRAKTEMDPVEFAEAHKWLLKVFGNVLKEPGNEKFRTLKKSNPIIQEKLKHPACVEMLRLCGFSDLGETYNCRPSADLTLMRKMQQLMPKQLMEAPPPGATRLVNGVIVREAKPAAEKEQPAGPRGVATLASTAAAPAAPAAAAPVVRATASSVPVPSRATVPAVPAAPQPQAAPQAAPQPGKAAPGAKPRSAFDFENRGQRERREQAQQTALQDLRREQKDRYQAEASGAPAAGQASAPPRQQQPPQPDRHECVLQ